MSINVGDYIEPDADRVSGDHLLGGPKVVTITGVKVYRNEKGKSRIELTLDEFNVPYRPCLSMARVLNEAWGGVDASTRYIGRKMLLFRDPDVKFGPQKMGGVRIKALSHIDGPVTASITVKQGKKGNYTVDPLPDVPVNPNADQIAALRAEWKTASEERRQEISVLVAELSAEAS
ncbi:hypothetical protein [Mycobacterium sp. DL99]|uniref:hypothetical protein n=1 Tax=Mycobacterium sp. DL99 TaxID=2528957 RepID=UPI0010817DAD|nr:hypothetical protein [Mycobacterium sp. DL99]